MEIKELLNQEFVFTAMGADIFVKEWNRYMRDYEFLSLSELLDNQLLLGQFEGSGESNKFIFNFYGWENKMKNRKTVGSAFEVRRNGRWYDYIFKIPEFDSYPWRS